VKKQKAGACGTGLQAHRDGSPVRWTWALALVHLRSVHQRRPPGNAPQSCIIVDIDGADSLDKKDLTMSPTYFVVRNADLDAKLEAARLDGDIRGMQTLLAEQTSLLRAMYGQPQTR
jgi:hypothetical protein